MTVRQTLAALTLSCVAVPTFADCYQSEWGLGYFNGESSVGGYSFDDGYTPPTEFESPGFPTTGTTDPLPPTEPITFPETGSAGDEDYDGFAINGEVFFDPVSCDGVPLKEAAFLGRASSIGGSYAQLDADDNTDLDAWNLFTRVVVNSWIFEGNVASTSIDGDFADADVDSYRVAAGRYLGDSSQILLAYDTSDLDGLDAKRLSASIKTLVTLESGMSYQVNALLGIVQQDGFAGADNDGFDLQVNADWYFNNQFSIGGTIEYADRDSVDSLISYTLDGTYFFTDRISLALTWRAPDDDAIAVFGDQLALQFTYRR